MSPKQSRNQGGAVHHQAGGTKCEVKIWHLRYTKDGSKEKISAPGLSDAIEPNVERYALVVERELDEKIRLQSSTVRVNSPHILKAFREVVGSHPSVANDFSEPFSVEVPSVMLYHCWDGLETYRDGLDDDVARMHLNLLLHYLEFDMGADKRNFQAQVRSGLVEFARLAILFRPGDTVIHHVKSQPWLLKVLKTAYEENTTEGKYFEVHCSYSDYDGINFGKSIEIIKILQKKRFGQENPARITDLEVYPRGFYQEDHQLENRLRERGNQFLSITGISVRQYDGLSEYIKYPPLDYFHPNEENFPQIWLPFYETGRIVIDRKTYEEDNYKDVVTKASRESLETEHCPPFVYGYSCGRKQWCRFFLQHLKKISWNSKAFEELVMPKTQKFLIQALVSSHVFLDGSRDLMQQKGKGLVCLLHGPPGAGKTLTAECAAELGQKALFSTSMSELNLYNRPAPFERRLAEIFRLATTWNAIVLLDEADVFLEARRDESPDAAERNALVAVFLRHLEYFSGIVFLTTNRIHVFDAAMKSRVHLAIGYNEPDDSIRRYIWTGHLKRIQDKDPDIEAALEELAKEPMNGREISNTINTASTLARYASVRLQLDHIQQVLNVRREFDLSLKRMKTAELSEKSVDDLDGSQLIRRDLD